MILSISFTPRVGFVLFTFECFYRRRTALRILRFGPTALPVLSNGLAPKRPDANPGDGAASGVVKAGADEPKLKLELTAGVDVLPN